MLSPQAYKTLLNNDPVYYADKVLDFQADEMQAKFLKATDEEIILNWSRQSGKTTVTAVKLTYNVMTTSNIQVLIISKTQRQAGIMQRIVKQFVFQAQKIERKWREVTSFDMHKDPLDDNSKMVRCSVMALELGNGSEVVSIPASADHVLGYSPDIIAIDEASRVLDELYYAILPMRMAHPCQLILTSTPNGRRGFFYEEWIGDLRPWLKLRLEASECPRIEEWKLDRERTAIPTDIYRQEYECDFLAVAGSLFTPEQIASMFTVRPEEQAMAAELATDSLAEAIPWRTAPIGQQLDVLFRQYLDKQ